MRVFLGLFLLFSVRAYASVDFEAGKPVLVELGPGRVATLYHARRKPLVYPLPFQVTENTCASPAGQHCRHYASLGFDTMYLGWAQHPDKAKLQRPLRVKKKSEPGANFVELFTFRIYGSADRLLTPKMAAELPRDRLQCGDYTWLPDGSLVAPESLYVQRWDVEMMQTNPQTGLMENATVGIALGLKLARDTKGGLEVLSTKKYTGSSLSVFAGDIWALVMKRPNGEFCQVSLKPNLTGFDKVFIEYLSQNIEHKPYLWGQDEFSTTEMPSYLKELKKIDDYDIE